MKWRRKVLFATLVLGAGVIGLRPLLRYSIEQRLHDHFEANVSIGQAHVHVGDGTVYLDDLRVSSTELPFKLDQAVIRIDPKELLFRHCIIESLTGRGLELEIGARNKEDYSVKSSTSEVMSKLTPDQTKTIEQAKSTIESVKSRMTQVERTLQSNTDIIDSRISELQTKIKSLANQSVGINPLRESHVVEELRSELLKIEQLLAEDRIAAKECDRIVEDSRRQTDTFVSNIQIAVHASEEEISLLSENIVEEVYSTLSNRIAPYVDTAECSYHRVSGIPVSALDTEKDSLVGSLSSDLVLPGLEPRLTRVKKAKLLGQANMGDEVRNVLFQLVSNTNLSSSFKSSLLTSFSAPTDATRSDSEFLKVSSSIIVNHLEDEKVTRFMNHIECLTRYGMIEIDRNVSRIKTDESWHIPIQHLSCSSIANQLELRFSTSKVREKSIDFRVTTDNTHQSPSKLIASNEAKAEIRGAIADSIELRSVEMKEIVKNSVVQISKAATGQIEQRKLALISGQASRQQAWGAQIEQIENDLAGFMESIRRTTRKNASLIR